MSKRKSKGRDRQECEVKWRGVKRKVYKKLRELVWGQDREENRRRELNKMEEKLRGLENVG